MVVSLEMVLPGVAGYWIDRRLNIIFPVFLLMGLVGGCIGGVWHLMRLTRIDARHDDRDGKRDSTRE